MKIIANCMIKNEERWIWFSLMSIIDYVDEILVWDLGSIDKTVPIVKSIENPKIKFRQVECLNANDFTNLKNKMLEETKADWILVLDGDEIWPSNVIAKTVDVIQNHGNKYDFLINRFRNLVGDVYHFQDELAGRYKIGNLFGHLTIRAVNRKSIPGLRFGLPYGSEGFFDDTSKPIQDRIPPKFFTINEPYLHATHLSRSTKAGDTNTMQRTKKYKFELGLPMENDFAYPSCFYKPYPLQVGSPWEKRTFGYLINACWQTPIKYLKRHLES